MNKNATAIFSLLDTPAFGGAEQYMFSHLRFLTNHGYTIILATNNETVKNEIFSRLTTKEKQTFHIIKAPYRLDAIGNWKGLVKFFLAAPLSLLWCYQTLNTLRKKYGEIICLWPGFSDRLLFSPIVKKMHIPLLWIEIGPLEPTFKKTFGFPKILYRFSEQFPSHIITTSLFTKKSIIKNTAFKDHDISLVYPGTKLFSERELNSYTKKAKIFRKQRHYQRTKLLTVVGRLAHENEIDMVVQGFSIYCKNNSTKSVCLLIIGEGPQRKELEALTKSLTIEKKVFFAGFVSEEEKLTCLAASDIFIFPRAWELDGFGMTTIEAMAQGIPVLTTDFGPQKEIVADGREGFRYIPHNSKNLAQHIDQIIDLPNEKKLRMIKAGLMRAKLFSEKQSHNKMLTIIKSYSNPT